MNAPLSPSKKPRMNKMRKLEDSNQCDPNKLLIPQRQYIDSLGDYALDIIDRYTGGDTESMQQMAMEFRTETAFDRLFNASPPLTRPITVYRGVPGPSFVRTTLQRYTSTTMKPYKTFNFMVSAEEKRDGQTAERLNRTCCLMRILLPAGSRVLPFFNVGFNTEECEVLLPRTGEFQITHEGVEDGTTVYDILYIPAPIDSLDYSTAKLSPEEWVALLTDSDNGYNITSYAAESPENDVENATRDIQDILDRNYFYNVPVGAFNEAVQTMVDMIREQREEVRGQQRQETGNSRQYGSRTTRVQSVYTEDID